jgi:spore maturation protein SpmA
MYFKRVFYSREALPNAVGLRVTATPLEGEAMTRRRAEMPQEKELCFQQISYMAIRRASVEQGIQSPTPCIRFRI